MAPFRPDTELLVVITDANGATKTLDSNARDPADRPQGLSFSTKLGAGFDVGGFNLSRLIDRDNIDVHLFDSVAFMGANGDTAYEGFVGELPRSTDSNGHTLTVTTAGWMAHTADEPFTEIFVDRDLSQWHEPSRGRVVSLVGTNFVQPTVPTVLFDATSSLQALVVQHADVWAAPLSPISEPWYDAGPSNRVGRIYYDFTNVGAATTGTAAWDLIVRTSSDDIFSAIPATSGDIWASVPVAGSVTDTTGTGRYAAISFYYTGGAGGASGTTYSVHARKLTVYGDHGLTLRGAEPAGVYASDVIVFLVSRYAPKISTAGVSSTTYPIAHLTFTDSTTVYDAILKVNSYTLWNFAVWEDRTLYYAPTDLTDWDWEIRHDEVGNQIGLQGDSVQDLRNGIIVDYTNVATGVTDQLHPDDHTELRDLSFDNPANIAGRKMYGSPFQIPFPTTAADALELGRIRLQEDLAPKAPGNFTVEGHIKDRAGNYQPTWKVRAGDRIRLTSSVSLSDRPRLVNETQYQHDSRTVTIGVDSTLRYLEGYLDRVTTSLQAAGLGS